MQRCLYDSPPFFLQHPQTLTLLEATNVQESVKVWKIKCKNRIQGVFLRRKLPDCLACKNCRVLQICRFIDFSDDSVYNVVCLSLHCRGRMRHMYLMTQCTDKNVLLNYRNTVQFLEWEGIKKYCYHENCIGSHDSLGWKRFRRFLTENGISYEIRLVTRGFIQS